MLTHQSRVKSPKANLSFSPDLVEDLKRRCRNPRCRCKLHEPTSILRNAFCCRACFTGFYRSRCLACEKPMERKREDQTTCGDPQCKRALKRDPAHYWGKWLQVPGESLSGVGNPIESGTKTAHKPDRPWRQVAGSPMRSVGLRLATAGADRAAQLEREQRAAVEAYLHDPDSTRAAQREAAYVATVKRGRPVPTPALRIPTSCGWEPASNIDPASVPDIPAFLRRGKESTS
jgi:hypothetical protein